MTEATRREMIATIMCIYRTLPAAEQRRIYAKFEARARGAVPEEGRS